MQEIRTSQQQGAVLVVALIMLLLLTLVSVAGMRDTQLQEKMAGGNEDRAIAFQSAEAALRAGELEVAGGAYTGGCVGLCFRDYTQPAPNDVFPPRVCDNPGPAVNCKETDYWQQYKWATAGNAKTYAGGGLTEVATQPRYVIEQLPLNYSNVPGSRNATGKGSDPGIQDFLITARGTGRSDNSIVILQSMYRVVIP